MGIGGWLAGWLYYSTGVPGITKFAHNIFLSVKSCLYDVNVSDHRAVCVCFVDGKKIYRFSPFPYSI